MTSPLPTESLLRETLPGGAHASLILKRGQMLRLTDLEGGANLALLAFNAHEKSERLNLPDTLKAQHTSRLTAGHCLYSDMGRVLLCIPEDTLGWHDALGGVSDAEEVQARYGIGSYQLLRNGFYRNGRDNLIVELGKWALHPRDLVMNMNFFSKVMGEADGSLRHVPEHSPAGARVDLYAPMDSLLVFTSIQHPMDPNPDYAPKPVGLELLRVADKQAATALCRAARPENARGFELTERLYL